MENQRITLRASEGTSAPEPKLSLSVASEFGSESAPTHLSTLSEIDRMPDGDICSHLTASPSHPLPLLPPTIHHNESLIPTDLCFFGFSPHLTFPAKRSDSASAPRHAESTSRLADAGLSPFVHTQSAYHPASFSGVPSVNIPPLQSPCESPCNAITCLSLSLARPARPGPSSAIFRHIPSCWQIRTVHPVIPSGLCSNVCLYQSSIKHQSTFINIQHSSINIHPSIRPSIYSSS